MDQKLNVQDNDNIEEKKISYEIKNHMAESNHKRLSKGKYNINRGCDSFLWFDSAM